MLFDTCRNIIKANIPQNLPVILKGAQQCGLVIEHGPMNQEVMV